MLHYLDWSVIVKISFLGLQFHKEGLLLASDLISRMNKNRLTTGKNNNLSLDISKERINHVLSLSPIYAYNEEEGYRYTISTGKKVGVRLDVKLIDPEGNELVFSSLVDCGKYLNEDRKRIARYLNTNKLLVSKHNPINKYYVVG